MEEDKLDLPEEEITARVNMYVYVFEGIGNYLLLNKQDYEIVEDTCLKF